MQKFGEKLRTLRKRLGVTMVELAPQLGFASQSYISELETGKKIPSLELAIKISRFFNVPVDQLVKDELDLTDI